MNQLYKLYIALALIVCLSTDIASQDEAVFHIDKPFYVAGEAVFYKAYLPGAFDGVSGKVKVVVESGDKSYRDESFIQLADGMLTGYFKVPFNISSDVYRFSFFALANGSFQAIEFTSFDIPIYNDLSGEGLKPIFPQLETAPIVSASGKKLKVNVENSFHTVRDEVGVSVSVTDASGKTTPAKVSISVTDASLLGGAGEGLTVFKRPISIANGVNLGFDERIYVQGKIKNANSEPVSVSVIGAYNAQENKMYYTKSNASGDFTLLMPDQSGPHTLQVVGYLYDEYADTKVEKKASRSMADDVSFTNAYDADVQNYINSSNKRKRIYQYFNQLENDFDVEPITIDRQDVKPNKSYKVKEYVNFENVGTFFSELLGGQLEFKKNGDKITARTYNPTSNRSRGRKNFDYLARSPVFIIDGKMTKDAEYIYNMKLDNIDKIDLYFDWRDITKQFGTFGEFGYVVITTTLADVEIPEADREDIFTYSGLQQNVTYPIEVKSMEKSIPVFKPSVYWNPTLQMKKASDGNLKFNASDDVSTFIVTVVAETEEGDILTGTTSYRTIDSE